MKIIFTLKPSLFGVLHCFVVASTTLHYLNNQNESLLKLQCGSSLIFFRFAFQSTQLYVCYLLNECFFSLKTCLLSAFELIHKVSFHFFLFLHAGRNLFRKNSCHHGIQGILVVDSPIEVGGASSVKLLELLWVLPQSFFIIS